MKITSFNLRAGRLIAGFVLTVFVGSGPASAQTTQDQEALNAVRALLFNDTERKALGATDPKARDANNYLEQFPADAQQEILEIVMLIMTESGEGALKHGDAFNKGGAAGAMKSFSPEVQKRIKALGEKLNKDPKFKKSQNTN